MCSLSWWADRMIDPVNASYDLKTNGSTGSPVKQQFQIQQSLHRKLVTPLVQAPRD
jgi:hypothetical protein